MLEAMAKSLAPLLSVSSERQIAIAKRCEEAGWCQHDLAWHRELDKAAEAMGETEAVALFERESLDDLARRVLHVQYLADHVTPWHTLGELADLLSGLVRYLQSNRAPLIERGHPETSFRDSRFLEWHLGTLYYVKEPLEMNVEMVPARRSNKGRRVNPRLTYTWAAEPHILSHHGIPDTDIELPTLGHRTLCGRPHTSDGRPVHTCCYSDAARLPSLTKSQAARLDELREPVFQARVDVLKRLLDGVYDGDAHRLWDDCLGVLTGKFTREDVAFLLEMDEHLSGQTISERTPYLWVRAHGIHNAGLTDLLAVVAHVEKELVIGPLHKTATRVDEVYDRRGELSSYFQLAAHAKRETLDEALDEFAKLNEEAGECLEGFAARLEDALRSAFPQSFTITTLMTAQEAQQYGRPLEAAVKFCTETIRATGSMPLVTLAARPERADSAEPTADQPPQAAARPPENVFRKVKSGKFRVRFRGQECELPNHKGVRCIHFLLAHAYKEYSPDYLEKTVDPGRAPASPRDPNRNRAEAQDGSLVENDAAFRQAIQDAVEQNREDKMLHDLEDEVRRAKADHDPEAQESAQSKLGKARRIIAEPRGKGGKSRSFRSEAVQQYDRMNRAIARAQEMLRSDDGEAYHQELWAHLNSALRKGSDLSYKPETAVPWVTE